MSKLNVTKLMHELKAETKAKELAEAKAKPKIKPGVNIELVKANKPVSRKKAKPANKPKVSAKVPRANKPVTRKRTKPKIKPAVSIEIAKTNKPVRFQKREQPKKPKVTMLYDRSLLPPTVEPMLQKVLAPYPVELEMPLNQRQYAEGGGYLSIRLPRKVLVMKEGGRIRQALMIVIMKGYETVREEVRGRLRFNLHIEDNKGMLHCHLNTRLNGENFKRSLKELLNDNRLNAEIQFINHFEYDAKHSRWVLMTDTGWMPLQTMVVKHTREQYEAACKHITHNEQEIKTSGLCGCISCRSTFASTRVQEWHTDDGGLTAVCPDCSEHSLVGSASSLPINNPQWLGDMNQYWDGRTVVMG